MIVVHTTPSVEADAGHGWEFILWHIDTFDFDAPFRRWLDEIVALLGKAEATSLDLPALQAEEDFIFGTLSFGNRQLRIYFEYSLGYLMISSDDRQALEETLAHILPLVSVVPMD